MEASVVLVRVAQEGDGRLRVVAPDVGCWSSQPHAGAVVGPGSHVGRLDRLNDTVELVLPEGAAGRVDAQPSRRIVAVEYGQTLFHLATLQEEDQKALAGRHLDVLDASGPDLPSGAHAVVAPTDGVFYRRSSPDVPPFVENGSKLRTGQPVGLVEVMKTFNQILYGGPGLPDEVEVLEIRAQDSEEVRAGQVLIVVR